MVDLVKLVASVAVQFSPGGLRRRVKYGSCTLIASFPLWLLHVSERRVIRWEQGHSTGGSWAFNWRFCWKNITWFRI